LKVGTKEYSVVYADPPYSYRVWGKKGRGRCAENHYTTMPIEDICALPVADIAARDCALLLWATYPNLERSFEIVKAWGFVYKTVAFTWCKRNRKNPNHFMGCGYYTRSNAEICLLATKGSPRRVSRSVRQIIDTPIERHSKKPDEARDRIVQLFGDIPRIELFARERADGWDCFGNEVASDITLIKNKTGGLIFEPSDQRGIAV
jgi:N6-adenosine-specific RNA methylase IME4